MGDLTQIHLRCQVSPDRLLERLLVGKDSTRERPPTGGWLPSATPEQDAQLTGTHLEHDRE
jgi:hypothetical protein